MFSPVRIGVRVHLHAVAATGQLVLFLLRGAAPVGAGEVGRIVIKAKHRGLSDIMHGLSYGEIDMGYGHGRPGYWDKNLNIEREAWAQIGRSLYQSDPKDIEMIQQLLPNTYKTVLKILEEAIC